jgi:hypothetical protein
VCVRARVLSPQSACFGEKKKRRKEGEKESEIESETLSIKLGENSKKYEQKSS